MKPLRVVFALLCLLIGIGALAASATDQPAAKMSGSVYVLTARGPIGPALFSYLEKGFVTARGNGAQLVLIELDTPGGLLSSTRDVVKLMTNSDIPVAVYVGPAGAHAASAGTFIVYASHIAGMAPGTNIGAATPIAMLAASEKPERISAVELKALADTNAFIRSLAKLRGRNPEWGQRAVTKAESLTAEEAIDQRVIEAVAVTRQDFLAQIEGRQLRVSDGRIKTLTLAHAPVVEFKQDILSRILIAITDPNIAVMLISLGVLGLAFEFILPGTLLGGISGAIFLLLGSYAMNTLPVNMAGILLICVGLGLLVAEAFVPSFGLLGIGGMIAFVLGASMVFEADHMPGLFLDMNLVYGLAAAVFIIMIGMGLIVARSFKAAPVAGPESMLGAEGEIVDWRGHAGTVRLFGEMWQAQSQADLAPGDKVVIRTVEDMILRVEPASSSLTT